MAKAFITKVDGKPITVEPDKAVQIWNCLNGHEEPTEQQAEFLVTVKDVFIPPSYQNQAIGYKEAHKLTPDSEPDTYKDRPGIEQGRSMGLPVNDR